MASVIAVASGQTVHLKSTTFHQLPAATQSAPSIGAVCTGCYYVRVHVLPTPIQVTCPGYAGTKCTFKVHINSMGWVAWNNSEGELIYSGDGVPAGNITPDPGDSPGTWVFYYAQPTGENPNVNLSWDWQINFTSTVSNQKANINLDLVCQSQYPNCAAYLLNLRYQQTLGLITVDTYTP
jgi:hypothetical protein